MKHLEVQGYCLAELALKHRDAPLEGLASNQQTVDSDTSGQVGGVTGIPGQPVQAPADVRLHGGVTGLATVAAACLHSSYCKVWPGVSSLQMSHVACFQTRHQSMADRKRIKSLHCCLLSVTADATGCTC